MVACLKRAAATVLLLALGPSCSLAFTFGNHRHDLAPRSSSALAFTNQRATSTTTTTTGLHAWVSPESAVWVADAADLAAPAINSNGFMDIARNIAIGLTAILFAMAGLTYWAASVIVPAAAAEVEKEAKELAPEIWDEYQAKLKPGETLAQNPELLQELAAKIQPLLEAKLEKQYGAQLAEAEAAAAAQEDSSSSSEAAPPAAATSSSAVIDVEVEPVAAKPAAEPDSPPATPTTPEPIIVDVSSMAGNQWADEGPTSSSTSDDEKPDKKKA